ncbi:hypothetical protein [uncultured Cetobacterium sp.]|uniref:hypothetical protein n=1 Tax=uncultured Cetobacterium sp. TaxID=527638 RepID=UPI002602A07E|nr:hypothetical protein [uncultured Cetobacterium sp.]
MINKKNSVLDRLKKDSFKKKEELKDSIESKEFEITVIENDFLSTNELLFNYDDIQDDEMKSDLIKYESLLNLVKSQYHSKAGEILLEANEKYASNKTGTFGIWLEHIKVGKKSAERLINRFRFLKTNCLSLEDQAYFESLPLSLTYEVSSPNANQDLVKAVLSKQIKTRKEYISLKEGLVSNKNSNQNLNNIEKLFNKLNSNISTLIENKIETSSLDSIKAKAVYNKIETLNNEIKSLLLDLDLYK